LYRPIERTMLTTIAATAGNRFIVRADEKLTAFFWKPNGRPTP
jgi:hypothetical protein